MRASLSILSALAATSVLLAASPTRANSDHCIFLRSISGWNAISDRAIIVYTGPRKAYRIDTVGYCYGLRDTETIAIDSRDGRVCWPSNNHIIMDYGRSCPVASILPMAPEKRKEKAAQD